MQVCVFPKTQTDKHKGEIKTHQQRKKIGKQRNPNNQNKNKYVQKVHLKTSCNNPLGN
jgi:ribosomal protein L44E